MKNWWSTVTELGIEAYMAHPILVEADLYLVQPHKRLIICIFYIAAKKMSMSEVKSTSSII